MLKIKSILDLGQRARKSHQQIFRTIRSGVAKSQVIKKAKPTPRVFVCPLVSKKRKSVSPDLVCNKINNLLCNNLNQLSYWHRNFLSFLRKYLGAKTNEICIPKQC